MFVIIKISFNYVTSAMLSGVKTAFKHARSSAKEKNNKNRSQKDFNKRNSDEVEGSDTTSDTTSGMVIPLKITTIIAYLRIS